MATLVWDTIGKRIFQTGVDQGVLYLNDGRVVPWNGIVDIEESTNSEVKSFHLDGVKFLESLIPGDFVGKLKVFTYPDEFDSVNGVGYVAPGFSVHDQPSKSFGLSYRTKIGNDVQGTEYGYRIHILYNIVAKPESYGFETLKNSGSQPIEFSWVLSGIPQKIAGFRPTVHFSFDSINTPPERMTMLKNKLYGTATTAPYLPSIMEIWDDFVLGSLIIVDNGNGTWTATDASDDFITMLDATTFQIDFANTVIIDVNTYQISNTNPGP